MYGQLRNLKGDRNFVPYRQLGQYEDVETGLYYNRFRYYSPESGVYISQDPIGLDGENPNFYGYVFDSNSEVDVFGLAGTPWLPQPDVISKGPHFYAGDGITELKLKLDGNGKVDFEEVFTKDSGTSKLNKAINDALQNFVVAKEAYIKCEDFLMQIESFRLCGWAAYEKGDVKLANQYYIEGYQLYPNLSQEIAVNSTFPYIVKKLMYNNDREKIISNIQMNKDMTTLFGEDWKEIADSYGKLNSVA
ncbi:RHS repeat domain-containing protein [Flavobacterium branchiophilum]|uniref:RHS repeat domain-containing protein n=1 Tax=Flavobacterium branchiophilum TaxID=55197 RepID=UPI0023EBC893|nr:RHS repeat-associated core domain-containing protein [Flavobacterium branchiophilum]